ncbi:HD-GYP domain-containing protein [Oryzobacter telluris]|uniref:HD-GYP domain-containing protein n=1 Tax=Oryzobacter telluris TaxID=3149179 RepID=UPI00370D6022
MSPSLRRRDGVLRAVVLGMGLLVVLVACLDAGGDLADVAGLHGRAFVVLTSGIVIGELIRLRMPSGRSTAPLSSATLTATALVSAIQGEPDFAVSSGFVVLVVALGMVLAAIVRRLRHQAVGLEQLAARLIAVTVTAWLARHVEFSGTTLWELGSQASTRDWLVGLGMVLVSVVGLAVEIVLVSALASESRRTPWWPTLRGQAGEVYPLTLAVATTGPLVALMAPALGLAALPAALFPLAFTYVAVARSTRNRETYLQTILTLSHLTEEGGYTLRGHAERVAGLSVRIGRVLGLSDRELRDLEVSALLHDLGQISLTEAIPDGATVLAAPADQRDIAAEGGRIIRHAEGLEDIALRVEGQTTAYRLVRELGEEVPMASRIIKAANAYDDITGGTDDPGRVEAALERINLGLGYEYDPEVVDALLAATADATVGAVEDRTPVSR